MATFLPFSAGTGSFLVSDKSSENGSFMRGENDLFHALEREFLISLGPLGTGLRGCGSPRSPKTPEKSKQLKSRAKVGFSGNPERRSKIGQRQVFQYKTIVLTYFWPIFDLLSGLPETQRFFLSGVLGLLGGSQPRKARYIRKITYPLTTCPIITNTWGLLTYQGSSRLGWGPFETQ